MENKTSKTQKLSENDLNQIKGGKEHLNQLLDTKSNDVTLPGGCWFSGCRDGCKSWCLSACSGGQCCASVD